MAAQQVVSLNTSTPQLEAPQAGSTYTFPRAITGTVAFGVAGSSLGAVSFSGNTSGTVTVQPAAAAGTWTFTLPTSAGTNNYALLTNGSGVTSWGQIAIGSAVSGLGTGVATALGINVGSAGAPVTFNGALGTPSSGTLTSCTGLPVSTGISGFGTGVATALAVNTGSAGAPVLFNGAGGTPSSLVLTNATGSPALTDPTITPSAPATNSVGYLGVPQNSKSAAYTTVMSDAGKHILHPASDNNARTFTIDSNANVAYPIGTALTFINLINTVTIAITSDTMYLAGTGSTGSRTLAAYGVATAVKVGTTTWIISGTGLT